MAIVILVSGATATHRRFADSGRFGHLLTPRNGNSARKVAAGELPWAADNDAFNGFDPLAFIRFLGRIAGLPGCRFVAAPDVVANADATLAKFRGWGPVIRELGLPVALVAQDGLDAIGGPFQLLRSPDGTCVGWPELDALFIGGSTEWKEGRMARLLCGEAKRHGKWVHMGRVNSLRRMRKAFAWGCDSVDGTAYSKWANKFFPDAMRWIGQLEATRPVMFDTAWNGQPMATQGRANYR